jgi:hypothetical protein
MFSKLTGRMGSASGGPRIMQRVVSMLRRLSSSPANVYTFGQGYLQVPANLLVYSQDFTNAAWTKSNSSTFVSNQTAAPDGASLAGKLTAANSGGTAVTESFAKVSGATYTAAFAVKISNVNRMLIGQQYGGASYSDTVFDLSTKSVVTTGGGSPTISYADLQNGWLLVAATVTATSSGSYVSYAGPVNSNGTGGGDSAIGSALFIHRAGLFTGALTATQIQAMGGIPWTMATASVNIQNNGNLFLNSGDKLASSWQRNSCVVTSAEVTSPMGVAAQVVTSSGTFSSVPPITPIAAVAGQVMTVWAEAKLGSGALTITDESQSGSFTATFNLTTGTVASSAGGTASILPLGGGWYKASYTYTVQPAKTTVQPKLWIGAYSGANTSGQFFLVGATQLELGPTATDYNPTTSAIPQTIVNCPVYTDAHAYLPGGSQTVYGPELVANGDFSQGTSGWTTYAGTTDALTIVSGAAYVKSNGNADKNPRLFLSTVLTPGKSYSLTYTVNTVVGPATAVLFRYGADGNLNGGSTLSATSAGVTRTQSFVAAATGTYAGFSLTSGGPEIESSFTIDNISVREVLTVSASVAGLTAGNYTLSDGSTGFSTVDGSDGLVLDAAGTVGAELLSTNFASGWGATAGFAFGGGTATVTSVPQNANSAFNAGLVIGKTYVLTITVQSISSGTIALLMSGGVGIGGITTAGTYTGIFVATGTNQVYLWAQSVGATNCVISFASAKEVTGIHASQPTAGFRPKLLRGAFNLALWSRDLSNAVWSKNSATATRNVTGVDGTSNSASKIGDLSAFTSQKQIVIQSVAVAASTTYTASTYFKAAEYGYVEFQVVDAVTSANFNRYPVIDLSNGSVSQLGGCTLNTNLFVTSIGSGWYRVAIIAALGASTTSLSITLGGRPVANNASYNGVIGSGIIADQVQLELGTVASNYSPTTSAAASNPNAGWYSWAFDAAAQQRLNLASVPFQRADDFCITFAARQNVTGAGSMVIFGMRNSASTNALIHLAVNTGGGVYAQLRDDASVNAAIIDNFNRVGQVFVATLWQVAGTRYLRINGVQIGSDATVLGTTTLNTATIGATTTTTTAEFMNGMIGASVIEKGTFTAAEVLANERWVALLTPNAPVF